MTIPSRTLNLITSAALLLTAGAPVARAFEPGAETAIGTGQFMRPRAVVAFADDQVFVLDGGQSCGECRPGQICSHAVPAALFHFRRGQGADAGWDGKAFHELPADTATLFPGPPRTLVTLDPKRFLSMLVPVQKGAAWQNAATVPMVSGSVVTDMGLDGAPVISCCTTAAGALALGFGRSVLLVTPTKGPAGKEQARWLVEPPAPGANLPPKTGPSLAWGMMVTPDGKDSVFVLDRKSRMIFHDKKIIAMPSAWPAGFQPDDVLAHRGQLLVAGKLGGPGTRALFTLTPQAAGPCAVQNLDLQVSDDATFTFTPGGHLVIAERRNARVRFIANRLAQEPATDTKADTKADDGAADSKREADSVAAADPG